MDALLSISSYEFTEAASGMKLHIEA